MPKNEDRSQYIDLVHAQFDACRILAEEALKNGLDCQVTYIPGDAPFVSTSASYRYGCQVCWDTKGGYDIWRYRKDNPNEGIHMVKKNINMSDIIKLLLFLEDNKSFN